MWRSAHCLPTLLGGGPRWGPGNVATGGHRTERRRAGRVWRRAGGAAGPSSREVVICQAGDLGHWSDNALSFRRLVAFKSAPLRALLGPPKRHFDTHVKGVKESKPGLTQVQPIDQMAKNFFNSDLADNLKYCQSFTSGESYYHRVRGRSHPLHGALKASSATKWPIHSAQDNRVDQCISR